MKSFENNMADKWALVTGSTAGIGWATAEAFAQAGYHVIILGRRQEKLQELQAKLRSTSPTTKVIAAELDITDVKAIKNFVEAHRDILSQLDVLVNNAGLAKGVDKMQTSQIADWDAMIDTNVKGLLYMTRALIGFMVTRNTGHIVNIGSVAGRWTYPGGGVYCATKFAVRALSEGLRLDLMGTKIRVTNIEPGMVETEFSFVRLGDQQKADQVYAGLTPLKAQDIAETILWCAQRPAHVNIQELLIFPTDQAGVGYVTRST